MTAYNKAKFSWAARRGMLELDLFLMPFVEAKFAQLTPTEKQTLEDLMTCTDMELYKWLTAKENPPAQFTVLIDTIRQYARHRAKTERE